MTLLDVRNLKTHFRTREGVVRAVDGVSFSIEPGEILGIVGESGCGKSVAVLSLMGLVPAPPAEIEADSVQFDGLDLLQGPAVERRAVRGARIAMVFQDPMTALNPYMSIGEQVIEPLRIHTRCPKAEGRDRAIRALEAVGISGAARRLTEYPHQFSGGMRQRVMIAMALILRPRLLFADEPTTALDVTVQAQVLDLIKTLQREHGMAVVLITHDIGVVAGMCGRVLVMYAGRIVESGVFGELFSNPRHPYTYSLLASTPSMRKRGEPLHTIRGLPPPFGQPVNGCAFAPRCRLATVACTATSPALWEISPGHHTACLRVQAGEV